jgi:hypothetical protein
MHLLIKDILGPKKSSKNDIPNKARKVYPPEYPFEDLLNLCKDMGEVFSFFENHHDQNSLLTNLQAELNVNKLSAQGDTRWGSIQKSAENMSKSAGILVEIVNDPDNDFLAVASASRPQREKIKSIITNPAFRRNLKRIIAICSPINILITMFQSDSRPVSEVYHKFEDLIKSFSDITQHPLLIYSEREYIVKMIRIRWDFIYADCHGVAYLMDIRYLGIAMDDDVRVNTVDYICDFPLRIDHINTETQKDEIRTEFNKYQLWARGLKTKSPTSYKQYETRSRSMLSYFLTEGGDKWPLLKHIGVRVFSLISTSACVERNNSVMGFI